MEKSNKSEKGNIFLINGISGSGKTTLANKLKDYLKNKCRNVYIIDSDITRHFFDYDLNYSQEGRFVYFGRNAYGAYLLSENGIDVIIAANWNLKKMREIFKRKVDFIHIYLDVDVKDCIKNDPKGIYKKNMHLDKPGIPGIDIIFEKPEDPDLILHPYKETPEESFKKIVEFLIKNKKI